MMHTDVVDRGRRLFDFLRQARLLKADTVKSVRTCSVEGPVTGSRLQLAYAEHAGGQRIGSGIGQVIDRALRAALRHGELVADDRGLDYQTRTFRLPAAFP